MDTVDPLAPNCSVNLSRGDAPKDVGQAYSAAAQGTVGMTDMGFVPPAITVNVGTKVVWKNSSQVIHNVVDDVTKALSRIDVKLPSGASPFDSGLLQPGQSYSRVLQSQAFTATFARCTRDRHERSSYRQAVVTAGSEAIDWLKLQFPA